MAETKAGEAVAAIDAVVEAAGQAEGAKMPQLDFSTFPNQIFWLLITLVVIYFVLSRIALPRIAAAVSYTPLRAPETVLDLVCRLLLDKKKKKNT